MFGLMNDAMKLENRLFINTLKLEKIFLNALEKSCIWIQILQKRK